MGYIVWAMTSDRLITLQNCIDGAVADLDFYLAGSNDTNPWGGDRKAMVHEIAANANPVGNVQLLQNAAFDAIKRALWTRLGREE